MAGKTDQFMGELDHTRDRVEVTASPWRGGTHFAPHAALRAAAHSDNKARKARRGEMRVRGIVDITPTRKMLRIFRFRLRVSSAATRRLQPHKGEVGIFVSRAVGEGQF